MGTHLKMSYAREHNFIRTLQTKIPVKPKPRTQHQGHFDPDELTRRLYLVLAEQKAHMEKKKARQDDAILKDARSWTRRQFGYKDGGKKSSSKEIVPERTSSAKEKSSRKPVPQSSSERAAATSADKARGDPPLRQKKSLKLKVGPPTTAKEQDTPATKPISIPTASSSTTNRAYHHIPKEAARQFTRTTTVDGMSSNPTAGGGVLTKMTLKYQQASRAQTHGVLTKAAGSNRRARDRRAILDESSSSEEEAHTPSEYRHTFQAELLRVAIPPDQRRNSTGDILHHAARASSDEQPHRFVVFVDSLAEALAEEASVSPSPPHAREPLSPTEVNEHRVDWTQSDEMCDDPKLQMQQAEVPATIQQRPRTGLGPLLRKADSMWMMKGRKGSTGGKMEVGAEFERVRSESPSKGPKSPKPGGGGFFAKFKGRG